MVYSNYRIKYDIMALSADQVAKWKNEGSVMVDGLLEESLLDQINLCANEVYGDSKTHHADFGATVSDVIFPSLQPENQILNEIPLHPKICTAVSQLLGCDMHDVRLSQCELWGKYGSQQTDLDDDNSSKDAIYDRSPNSDQRIHIDAFNHYLTFPSPWDKPEAVSMIIYYNDSDICNGMTAVVPRQGPNDPAYHPSEHSLGCHPFLLTPGGRSDLIWTNAKKKAEARLEQTHPDIAEFRAKHLYGREIKIPFKRGSILFYRLDTWHRGTPVIPGQHRRVHNLVYRRAGCDWINSWNAGAARHMYTLNQTIEKLISSRQEAVVLGFPASHTAYWTEELERFCHARYEAIGYHK